MRALFAGEEVTCDGPVRVDRARLWSRSEQPPPLVGAAVSPATARWVGGWADGLITVNQPVDQLAEVVSAFREGGGEGKPMRLQVHLSYASDEATALRLAHEQWRYGIFGSDVAWELAMPADYESAARYVSPDAMRGHVLVSASAQRHAQWLADFAGLGFGELQLHHVGKEQQQFIDVFAGQVLPELRAL